MQRIEKSSASLAAQASKQAHQRANDLCFRTRGGKEVQSDA